MCVQVGGTGVEGIFWDRATVWEDGGRYRGGHPCGASTVGSARPGVGMGIPPCWSL